MVKFSDSSHNILKEYFDVLITPRTGTQNSFIQGQRRTISAQGGLDTTLYQKNDNGDFVAHRFLVQSIEDDNFKYQYIGQLSDHSEATELAAGQEMYFRKDSLFHDWLKVHATQYEQSINTNKTFIYFGKLYTVSGEEVFSNYNIIFDGMKNFVTEALPENNRTEKVVELLKVFFDEVYHDIYNMTKTLWSFFDAREVDIDHLNYLATRANIETDVEKISTELKLREFVDTLPWWLKRKGSYSSYLSLYKLLLGNTKNKLNFYERWSEWCLKFLRENEGIIYNTDFEDHHYLEFYSKSPTGGAGPFYYDQFNHANYPTYTDTAPNENNCLENQIFCQILTTFDGFTGEDTGTNLTQVGFNIQIDGFNSAAGDDLYLFNAPAVSATDFNHCLTVSMDNTAQPSGGLFIWAVSDHADATLDEHNTANENWLGISFDILGDTPSGAVTGRRFRLWDTVSSTSTAKDSSGSYSADTNYYLSIEKYQDELTLKVFNDERRRDQDLKEKIRLPLTENKGYNTIYMPNYLAAPVGCDWTGDIFNWYTAAGNTNTIELSGNMILTPHYRVEIDLSSEPMGDDFIISENQATELIRYWEYLKPVSKFVHYNWLLSPVGQIDENSKSIPLYAIRDTAFCNTQFLGQNYVSGSPVVEDFGPDGDWYNRVYIQEFLTSQDEWIIRHNLNTNELIIQTYDKDNFQTWPITHEFTSLDRVNIPWNDTKRGKVLIAELKPGNYSHFQTSPASAWNINHNMGTSGASGVVFEVVSVSGAQDMDLSDAAELDTHFDIGPIEHWTTYFGTSAWSVSGGWTFDSGRNIFEATAINGKSFAVLEPTGNWAEDFRRERVRLTFTTSGAGIPSGSWILNGDPNDYNVYTVDPNAQNIYTIEPDTGDINLAPRLFINGSEYELEDVFGAPAGYWSMVRDNWQESYQAGSAANRNQGIQNTWTLEYGDGTWTVAGSQSSKMIIQDAPQSKINFTEYKETDSAYVYRDFGASFFKDFEVEWVWKLEKSILGAESLQACFANAIGDGGDIGYTSADGIFLMMMEESNRFRVWIYNNGSVDAELNLENGSPYEPNHGPVYFKMKRAAGDIKVYAYRDPRDGTNPWETKQWYNTDPTSGGILGGSTTGYRYFYPHMSKDSAGSANTASSWVSGANFLYVEDNIPASGANVFRWQDINIAQGTTITDAYMKMYVNQAGRPDAAQTRVYALEEDSGNIPADLAEWKIDVGNTMKGAANPNLTSNYVDWNLESSGGYQELGYAISPSLVNVIQEIVDRPSWAANNELITYLLPQPLEEITTPISAAKAWNVIAQSSEPAESEKIIFTPDFTDWWYDRPGDINNLRFQLLPTAENQQPSGYFNSLSNSNNFIDTANGIDGDNGTYTYIPTITEKVLTIDTDDLLHEGRSTDLTDFPLMINLSDSCGKDDTDMSEVFSNLGDNYQKFYVKDTDGTNLPVEVENWNGSVASPSGAVWVRVPSIPMGDLKILTLEYDITADDNPKIGLTGSVEAAAVWDRYYAHVYHMNRTPLDGEPNVWNSQITSGGNLIAVEMGDEKLYDTRNSGDRFTPSGAGKSISFPAVDNSRIESVSGAYDMRNDNAFTMEAHFRPNVWPAGSQNDYIIHFNHTDEVNWGASLYVEDSENSIRSNVSIGAGSDTIIIGTGSQLQKPEGRWLYAGAKWSDDGNQYMKIGHTWWGENMRITSGNQPYGTGNAGIGQEGVFHRGGGALRIGDSSGTAGRQFPGLIGEVRYSRIERSNTYLKATNETLFDKLNSFAATAAASGSIDYYYTNDFTSTNWTNTGNAVDGSEATAATAPNLDISSLGVRDGLPTFSASGGKTIDNVFFRVYGDNVLGAGCDTYPIFPGGSGDIRNIDGLGGEWSAWFDITDDSNAPGAGSWTWEDFQQLKIWLLSDFQGAGETYDVMKIEAKADYTSLLGSLDESVSGSYITDGSTVVQSGDINKVEIRVKKEGSTTSELRPVYNDTQFGDSIDITSVEGWSDWFDITADSEAPDWSDISVLGAAVHTDVSPGLYKLYSTEIRLSERVQVLTDYQLRKIEFWDNTVSAGKISFDTMPRKAESNILFEDRGIQPEFEFWFDFRITSAGRGIENKGGQVALLTVSDVQIDDIRDLSRLPSGAYAVSLRAASLSGDMYMLLSDHSPSAEYTTEWNIGSTSRGDSTSTDQLFIKFNRYTAWGETTQPAIVVEYYPNADRKTTELIYRQVHFLNSNGALLANDYTYALNAFGEIPSAGEFFAYGPSGAFESNYIIFSDRSGDSYSTNYDDEWETTPENMVDSDLATFAQEEESHAWQEVYSLNENFVLPAGRNIESIKMRAHGLAGGPPRSWDLQPFFNNTPTSATYYYDTYRAGFTSNSDNAVDGSEATVATAFGSTQDQQEIVFISHTASGDTPLTGEISKVEIRFFGKYGSDGTDNLHFEAFFDGTQVGNSQWGLQSRWGSGVDTWSEWVNVSDEVPGPGWGASPSQKGVGWTWDDLLNLDFKLTYDGSTGSPNDYCRIGKCEIRVIMGGEYYRLRDANIPLSDQTIVASAGTGWYLTRGVKPGKPNRGVGSGGGGSGSYFCAFDGDGNFWTANRSSDYLNHINTQEKNVTCGHIFKHFGRSSLIDKIYEPSGAAGGSGSDFGGKHLGSGSSAAIWWPIGLFYNENTGRMGHCMQNQIVDDIRILEFSETAVDYPNQMTYEKDLTLPGSWADNAVRGLTYDPVNDNYIMNYNGVLYVLNAADGTILRQRAVRLPAGYSNSWGLDVSGGVLFQPAEDSANPPVIYALDPLTLTASTSVQPSAVEFTFQGNGALYGGLAADKTTDNWYSGDATGTRWMASRKWSSDALPANSLADYSGWIDITNDPNAPNEWTEEDVNTLRVRNIFFENPDNERLTPNLNYVRTTQIEIQANYSPSGIELPPSGTDAITGYSQNWRQIYDDNPVIIIPARAQQVTKNDLKLTFSEAIDGKCFIRDDDYYHQQTVAATIWNINHNLNIAAAIIMCYDTDENLIFPKSIKLVDSDNTQIVFNEDTAGTAVFVIFQNEFTTGSFVGAFDDGGFWKAGDGGDEVGFDPLENNDINSVLVSGTLDDFIETTSAASGSVLINFEVPMNGAYQFNEFGIFDGDKNLHYYTKNSNLYKPDGVSLNLRYRISKTAEV